MERNQSGSRFRWKNLKVGKKLGIGFGIVVLLCAVMGCCAVIGIKWVLGNADHFAEASHLRSELMQREIDHLNWAKKVSALLTDDKVTSLEVQTDPHKCGFGKWYDGQDRKAAEQHIPEIKELLHQMEEPHKVLHESAIEIAEVFQQADSHLPTLVSERENDHLKWIHKVEQLFAENLPRLEVETDDHRCGLGGWLYGENGQNAAACDPELARLLNNLEEPHHRLHASAIKIQNLWRQRHDGLIDTLRMRMDDHRRWACAVSTALLHGDKVDVETDPTMCAFGEWITGEECKSMCAAWPEFAEIIAKLHAPHGRLHDSVVKINQESEQDAKLTIHREETEPALNEVAGLFQQAIELEMENILAQQQARGIYTKETLPALADVQSVLKALKQRATSMVEGMNKANKIFADKAQPNLASVQGLLSEINEKVRADVDEDEARMAATGHRIQTVSLVLGLVVIAVGIVMAYVITRGITRPIHKGLTFAETVARGDLAQRVDIDQQDEIGALGKALNEMAGNLQKLVGNLADNAQTLTGSSTELSSTASQLASGAEETTNQSATVASAAEQMSANMNNMAAASEQMTTNIRTVSSATEQMTASIAEIAKNAERASTVAGDAAQKAQASNETVGELGTAADEIGKVIEVIQDIAEQTNLLALNATIEAARAGEAGKGFAVVATEVKELAKQTADATEDIRDRINGIQSSSTEAVTSIGEIGGVIQLVNEVSQTIASAVEEQSITTREIAENIAQTSGAAETVSTGVNQSAMASQEITQNVAGVDQAAKQTAQGAAQTQTAGTELSRLAEELNTLVGQFKV